MVQDEGGQEYFFRYYDPRVLRKYLPTCTPEEVRSFFGPVRSFIAENNAPALAEMAARFREAIDRGLWVPRLNSVHETLTALTREHREAAE